MTDPRPTAAEALANLRQVRPSAAEALAQLRAEPTAADFADVQGGSSVPVRGAQPFGRMGTVAGTAPSAPSHMGEDLTRAGLQGVTFGLADEAGAFGQAIGERLSGRTPDLMARYRELQGQEQAKLDQFAHEHPVLNVGTQIAASLPLAVAAGARAGSAPVVQSLGRRILTGTAEGAALGAAQGAAQSHPDERLTGGVIGGAGGAILGAAAPVVTDAAGAGIRAIRGKLGSMGETGALMPGRVPGRSLTPRPQEPNRRALDLILNRLGQGEQSPADLERMGWEHAGKPFVPADASEPMRRLAETVAQTPTKGAERLVSFATQRAEDFTKRAMTDLTGALGVKSTNAVRLTADLMTQRQQAAQPLYRALYEAVDNAGGVPLTPELRAVLEHPDARAAFGAARETAGRFKAAGQGDGLTALYDNAGRIRDGVDAVPMEVIDRIKQSLDAPIKWEAPGNPNAPTAMRRADASDKALVGRLVSLVDDHLKAAGITDAPGGQSLYAAARQSFAGPSAEIRALKQGVKAWRMRPEEIADALRRMGSDGEREMFRAGMAREAPPKLAAIMAQGESPQTVVRRGALTAQLEAAFPDPASFARYRELLTQEQGLARLYPAVAGGSQTARRLLGAQDVGQAAAAAGDVATGRPMSAVSRLMGDAGRAAYRRLQGITPEVADALGGQLTATGADQTALIQALIRREVERRAAQRAAQTGGAALAGQVGGMAGRPSP